jgi:signal peptidase I
MSDGLIGHSVPEDTSGGDPRGSGPPATAHPAANNPADRAEYGRPAEPGGPGGPSAATSASDSAAPAGDDDPGRPDGSAPQADAEPSANAENEGEKADAAAKGTAKGGKPNRSLWRELPLLVLIALVIALLIKTFVVQAFFIPSASMENTLEIGDKILVNKVVYDFRSIQPGDIIVFDGTGSWDSAPPAAKVSSNPLARAYHDTLGWLFSSIAGIFGTVPGQTDYIKRVIGVPGDKVACCDAQGLVTVNGVPLHEQSYLFPGEQPGMAPAGYSGRFSVRVPPGRLWVMGDNRAVSDDSRLRQNLPGHGTIPESAVIGRAFIIVWPASRWRILPIPSTFLQHGVASGAGSTVYATAGAASTSALPGTVRVAPAAPYLPLAGGFAVAVPLTWIQRVARRRVRGRRFRPRRS